MATFTLRPIGHVHSPFANTSQIPKGCGAEHHAEGDHGRGHSRGDENGHLLERERVRCLGAHPMTSMSTLSSP